VQFSYVDIDNDTYGMFEETSFDSYPLSLTKKRIKKKDKWNIHDDETQSFNLNYYFIHQINAYYKITIFISKYLLII